MDDSVRWFQVAFIFLDLLLRLSKSASNGSDSLCFFWTFLSGAPFLGAAFLSVRDLAADTVATIPGSEK